MSEVTTPDSVLQRRESRERYLLLALLLLFTAAAWAFLLWEPIPMQDGAPSLTMGLGAFLFLGIWMAMMVAMMFPSAAPMILMFSRVYAGKRHDPSFVPTWIFVSAYLAIWGLFGVVGYAAAVALEWLAQQWPWLGDNAGRIGGALLVLGGLYQLSPLKNVCLAKCRTPLGFILGSWRSGYRGSFIMGLQHGLYCLGCCWMLFVILFPLGIMNIAAMAGLTLLIYAEKSLPAGRRLAQLAAVALIAYGAVVLAVPNMLPAMPSSMPMSGGTSPAMAPTPTPMPMR